MWLCLSDSNITNITLDSYLLSRATIVITRRGRLDSWQPPSPLHISKSAVECASQKLARKQFLTHRPYISSLGAGGTILGRGPRCIPGKYGPWCQGKKRPGCGVGHLPPSVEFRIEWTLSLLLYMPLWRGQRQLRLFTYTAENIKGL
jgi:hypothetical protein